MDDLKTKAAAPIPPVSADGEQPIHKTSDSIAENLTENNPPEQSFEEKYRQILQKEKRTDRAAVLEVSGRDQQDQRLYLTRDMDHLTWQLERTETELWKPPPDPVLEAIAKLVTRDKPWSGTATELVTALGVDLKPNTLTMRLNVNAGRLLNEHSIRYENHRNHDGRKVSLTLVPPQA